MYLFAGVEGKAGMAALGTAGSSFDLDAFLIAVKKALPSYACPLFLRLMPAAVETTGRILDQDNVYNLSNLTLIY